MYREDYDRANAQERGAEDVFSKPIRAGKRTYFFDVKSTKGNKNALRKLKANLYSGAYGRWLAIRKAIDRAKAEADSGSYTTPQTTWTDEKK